MEVSDNVQLIRIKPIEGKIVSFLHIALSMNLYVDL